MLKVKSLRVDYEGVTAVSDADFQVEGGQVYGLVGPNGAGKTSTLKALAGIIEPTYGKIEICGLDLEEQPRQAMQHIGFMPDFPPVYENLKVWEYLDVFAAAYFVPRSKRIGLAKEWVRRVNLTEKWDAYIHSLSRGMRQRLVLAKTLLHDPEVILLDEPASGLDPIARVEMRDILKEIAKMGKAIMISSHILTELSNFCNAIGIMEKGKMVVSGSIDEIRSHIGMKGELVIYVADLNDAARNELLNCLGQADFVSQAKEAQPGEFRALFSGDKRQAADLLSELVRRNIAVNQFFVKEADLEDVFFKIGAKEVT
jgi:ABC-2 type transport system ATP-binding protein